MRIHFFSKIVFFAEMIIRQTVVLTVLTLKYSVIEANEELEKFQKLFMQKRIEQLGAVKNILKLDEIKRRTLLDQITQKLFQVSFNH